MADFARGERLRDLREKRHLSQEEAAHEIGVSVKTIRAWEKGKGIRWQNALTVSRFYGVDPESLVSRDEGGDSLVGQGSGEAEHQLNRIEAKLDQLLDHFDLAELEALADDDDQAAAPPSVRTPKRPAAGSAKR